jgi:hypothetical protein
MSLARIVRVVSAAVVMAGVAVWGAGPVAADSAGVTLRYTCTVAPFPGQAMTARLAWHVPDSVLVGQTTPALPIEVTATLSATVTYGAGLVGAATVSGRADAEGVVVAPEGDIGVTVPLTVPRTEVPASGPMTVMANGTTPGLVFHQPGPATITIGSVLVLRVDLQNADGGPAQVSHVDASCTLDPGQNNVLSSFEITAASLTTSRDAGPTGTGTDPTATHGPSGSRPAPTGSPSPEVSVTTRPTTTTDLSGATGEAGGPVSPSATVVAAGRTVNWWLVGAALIVVAGASGWVWWLIRRRRRRA